MWNETSESVRVDYGDTYFAAFLSNMLRNLRRSSRKTYMVIDDLVHATTARYPYTRYVPGTKIQIMADMFAIHPNFVQDYGLDRILKVPCVPFMMRTKKTV